MRLEDVCRPVAGPSFPRKSPLRLRSVFFESSRRFSPVIIERVRLGLGFGTKYPPVDHQMLQRTVVAAGYTAVTTSSTMNDFDAHSVGGGISSSAGGGSDVETVSNASVGGLGIGSVSVSTRVRAPSDPPPTSNAAGSGSAAGHTATGRGRHHIRTSSYGSVTSMMGGGDTPTGMYRPEERAAGAASPTAAWSPSGKSAKSKSERLKSTGGGLMIGAISKTPQKRSFAATRERKEQHGDSVWLSVREAWRGRAGGRKKRNGRTRTESDFSTASAALQGDRPRRRSSRGKAQEPPADGPFCPISDQLAPPPPTNLQPNACQLTGRCFCLDTPTSSAQPRWLFPTLPCPNVHGYSGFQPAQMQLLPHNQKGPVIPYGHASLREALHRRFIGDTAQGSASKRDLARRDLQYRMNQKLLVRERGRVAIGHFYFDSDFDSGNGGRVDRVVKPRNAVRGLNCVQGAGATPLGRGLKRKVAPAEFGPGGVVHLFSSKQGPALPPGGAAADTAQSGTPVPQCLPTSLGSSDWGTTSAGGPSTLRSAHHCYPEDEADRSAPSSSGSACRDCQTRAPAWAAPAAGPKVRSFPRATVSGTKTRSTTGRPRKTKKRSRRPASCTRKRRNLR